MFRRTVRAVRDFDWVLFAAMVSLVAVGMAAIASVTLSQSTPDFGGLMKQGVAFSLGLMLVFVVGAMNYRAFEPAARIFYLLGAALLIAVLFVGQTVRGTMGWFSIAGWSFQPVEAAKIALVIFLARYFSHHAYQRDLRSLVGSGVGALLLVGLTLLQPDFGSAMVLLATWVALLLLSGTRRSYVVTLLGLAATIAVVAWLFLLKPYQQERILTFIDPSRDPLGRGYNLTQSVIAVGSGGVFGRGLGFGSQSQLRFLPEAQTDFIFAVVAEEMGFVAVVAVLVLYALLVWRAIRLARLATDTFTAHVAAGIAILFTIQITINVGMNMGLMPVTGIALPFISYGGSSLLFSMVMVGILESIAVRQRSAALTTIDVLEHGW